jgi:hypothetical protein
MDIPYRKLENFLREFLKPIGIENKSIKQRDVPININMKLLTILFSLFFS